MSPDELLTAWRSGREELASAAATLANDTRIAWYGPSMGSKSFLTARLMEAWAHGQDVVDAVGATGEPTDRLRHIAQLGSITRGWTYVNRGLDVPSTPVRVELTSPSGETWAFGPDDAAESIVGTAEDFCLVTTQRHHVDDHRTRRHRRLRSRLDGEGPTVRRPPVRRPAGSNTLTSPNPKVRWRSLSGRIATHF